MKVSEIFKSIEGEGIRAGYPALFIRLFGCNLDCSYCDSVYACKVTKDNEHPFEYWSIETILDMVKISGVDKVTLTGGEPLLQKESIDLVTKLLDEGYEVNIETNGSIDIQPYLSLDHSENLIITMDWKSISSNMADKMLSYNLNLLRKCDVLKFVVGEERDLVQMSQVLNSNYLSCNVFVSPIFDEIEPKTIVEYILHENLNNVRMQLQLHKFIWEPDRRGV